MAWLEANGVRLRYVREGSGDPVLLLHGYLFGADWWRPQIDALADRFDVVAVDLRGQMGSEASADPDGYDLWNQAEDVHAVMAGLDLAPAHVVGLSMGGMIAMRCALSHPEDVRSLVLMDTSAEPEEPEKIAQYEGMLQVVEAGHIEAALPALPPIFLADDFIVEHRDAVDAWLAALRDSDPTGVVRAGRGVNARASIADRLGEIRVPTLVIHGEDDVPIPVEVGRRLAAGIAGARFEPTTGGHQSNVDRAAETARLIGDFLASLADRPDAPR